jgi:hypothetical protein
VGEVAFGSIMRVTKHTFPHWQSIAYGFMKVDFGSHALYFKRNEAKNCEQPQLKVVFYS